MQSAYEDLDASDPSTDARLAHANSMAGYVGDMCLGISFSRFQWGLHFLAGWPTRAILFDSRDVEKAKTEVKSQWEVVEKMRIRGSLACKSKAARPNTCIQLRASISYFCSEATAGTSPTR